MRGDKEQVEQVIVVGGGPVGLWLAAELRLGGASVTLLETREAPDPRSKALTVHPRTVELLACRGIADRFLAEGVRIADGHFGGLARRLDFSVLDTPFPFTLALPQARTEELLEEHARTTGVRILRGHRVTGLEQGADTDAGAEDTNDAVTVRVEGPDGPYEREAAYVVGCDGTRSTVRSAAGIDYPGTDTTVWGWLGDVVLDRPPERTGFELGSEGGMMAVPMPGGVYRLVGGSPDSLRTDWPGELTLEELRATVTRITGTDFGMRDPRWLSRFGNATRQAARYRKGRVLLAGDAAHMHFPAGGVGLNVGVQDAANLGWKLAATVCGRAPGDALLDSYHAERHPVGAELLTSTRAQTTLMATFTVENQALRTLLSELIGDVPEFSKVLADRLSGLSVSYPAPDGAHPLTGTRAPDLAFADSADGLFALLHDGRHILLDLTGRRADAYAEPGPGMPSGIRVHSAPLAGRRADWAGVRTALIRPDGHVAWASQGDEGPPSGAGWAVAGGAGARGARGATAGWRGAKELT